MIQDVVVDVMSDHQHCEHHEWKVRQSALQEDDADTEMTTISAPDDAPFPPSPTSTTGASLVPYLIITASQPIHTHNRTPWEEQHPKQSGNCQRRSLQRPDPCQNGQTSSYQLNPLCRISNLHRRGRRDQRHHPHRRLHHQHHQLDIDKMRFRMVGWRVAAASAGTNPAVHRSVDRIPSFPATRTIVSRRPALCTIIS